MKAIDRTKQLLTTGNTAKVIAKQQDDIHHTMIINFLYGSLSHTEDSNEKRDKQHK